MFENTSNNQNLYYLKAAVYSEEWKLKLKRGLSNSKTTPTAFES
jgi:hypothetical protein